ncbi:MAG: CotH kinase family protein [Eggerthellaceae bacterium]|nr:CotH kinase family protein [Eggerthellaceae bacterium]
MRRFRLVAVLSCVVVLVVCAGAVVLDNMGPSGIERYWQHEHAQQLEDLPEADREAASSLNIDAETFASHLPVVSIDTGGQEIPGERVNTSGVDNDGETHANILVIDESRDRAVTLAPDGRETVATSFSLFSNEGTANRLSDAPAFSTQAELRIRGNSSRLFDKKSYSVHFTESDRLTARDFDVLDMGEEDEWILNGPFLDKTMMRNYLSMNVAGEFMAYTPDVRFCELFIDGQYQGVYVLMESVKYGDDRVPLTESDPKSAATSYIVRRDWRDVTNRNLDDLLEVTRYTEGAPLSVVYPSQSKATDEQLAWVKAVINQIEKSLYSYDYDTSSYGYWNYLDANTFVDYLIMSEFSSNTDAGSYSTFFYKDIRGKLCVGPVWDFNNAFNNSMDYDLSDMGFFMQNKTMFDMLVKDEKFVEQVIARYRELREDTLSTDRLTEIIDETVDYLGPAIERNFAVWGYSFDATVVDDDNKLSPDERNSVSFEAAIGRLKENITERGAWLDRCIENLRQFSHESAVKKFNH